MAGDFNMRKPAFVEGVSTLMEAKTVIGKDLLAVSTATSMESITPVRKVYGADTAHAVEFISVLLASSQESSQGDPRPPVANLEDCICHHVASSE